MKIMVKSSRLLKSLLAAGLLAAPNLAFNVMAAESDNHWSPLDVLDDGNGPYAYFGDANNWDAAVVPGYTNDAGAYVRVMVSQAAGSHVTSVITNSANLYQLMIGAGNGGDVVITNGAQVTAGVPMYGGGQQWTGVGFPDGPSTLTIGTGSSLSCGDHLWVGNGGGAEDVGTVKIDGGELHITGQLGLGWNGFPGTTNYLTLTNGGHLFLNQWAGPTLGQNGCVGILNIAGNSSSVIVNGNVTGFFSSLTNSHQLIAYGGAGTITWNYNPGLNVTTINAVAPVNPNTPIFDVQPTNTIVALNASATLSAHVSNVASVDYQWLFNNTPITDGNGYSGAHTATLTIASVNGSKTGNYSVVATNHNVTTEFTLSAIAALSANSLSINPVVTINGVVGDTYVVQYTASLTPPVTWTPFATNTLGTPIQYVIDLTSPLGLQRFYRVLQQ